MHIILPILKNVKGFLKKSFAFFLLVRFTKCLKKYPKKHVKNGKKTGKNAIYSFVLAKIWLNKPKK